MAKIAILKDTFDFPCFEGDEYVVDTRKKFEGYEKGDLICFGYPFNGVPLELEIAIRTDGSIAFRSWMWGNGDNPYFHTNETPNTFTASNKQVDTVNGLFSGRIRFDGLKLSIGGTVQDICPIDHKREEKLTGKRIYLNLRERGD